MVIQEGVAAGGSHSVELVVGKALAEVAAGSSQGVQEVIAGIVEAVGPKDGFEAAFIEAGVMGNKGDIGRKAVRFEGGQDVVFQLVPDVREERGIFRIVGAEAMDLLAEPGISVYTPGAIPLRKAFTSPSR